jgi:hypothetical protein
MLQGSPASLPPDQVVRNVEQFLLLGRSRRAWRVRVLCLVVELAPVFLLFTRRFSRLSVERRARLVRERYVGGRYLWALCAKIKHLVYLGAYGDGEAAATVGFVAWPERPRYRDLQQGEPSRGDAGAVPPKSHRGGAGSL